jgi:hypothetical protein
MGTAWEQHGMCESALKGLAFKETFNLLTPELNPSEQCCLPKCFTGILIFKGLIARRIYKSFGVEGLISNKSAKLGHCIKGESS